MKIRTRFLSAYSMPGGGWFRLFGVGLGWKDTRRIPLSFSERNGYKKHWMLGAWSFAVMWREKPNAYAAPGGAQGRGDMSIHVCKCEHNGRTEYQLRYPGMTQEEAQALADRINGGELVGAEHPLRKDAERYRKLVATGKYTAASIGGGWGLACGGGRWTKAELDAAADALPAVGAA